MVVSVCRVNFYGNGYNKWSRGFSHSRLLEEIKERTIYLEVINNRQL